MCDRGGSWICAIDNEVEMEKNSQRELQSSFRFQTYQSTEGCNLNEQISQKCKCCLRTSFGSVPIYQLMSECFTVGFNFVYPLICPLFTFTFQFGFINSINVT